MGETKLHEELLRLLTSDPAHFHSGGAISASLGVTRAAVWKGIEQLRAQGYRIDSATNRGYRLADVPDTLSASTVVYWLGASRPQPLTVLAEVDSTNACLQNLAFSGAPEGAAVVAAAQTAGRGRRGRSFFSPPGGLYLSYLLRPQPEDQNFNLLTSFVGLLVCEVLQSFGVDARIKWPNDVLYQGKKLCGILTNLSTDAETATLTAAVIGVGVNVAGQAADFPEELRDKAGTLAQCGVCVPRAQLAARILAAFDRAFLAERWLSGDAKAQIDRLRARSCVLGQRVTIVEPDRSWQAKAVGIAENGGLIVESADGVHTLTSGEISVRGLLGYA